MSVLPEAGVISFARGIPSPDLLPVAQLAECAGRAANRVALNYGAPFGYAPLREWLAERHDVTPDRVMVTPGSLIALNFIVGATSGRAIVEAPTYDRMLHTLAGAEIVRVDRGDDGLDLDRLAAAVMPDTRFLYVLPTFHNPSGRTLTGAQRRALADLAVERGLLVYEDDPYRDVRIDGEAEPYLQSLLPPELCVFTSSFSKTVAPGLRVGWFVVPEALRADFDDRAVSTYISPPLLPQAIVHELFADGSFESNLERITSILGAQRDAMLGALERELDGRAEWSTPDGGYFVWLELDGGVDTTELLPHATEAGVTFVRGADFFVGGEGGKSAARLAFSYEPPERIGEGVRILASLL
jgi:DNA-binding transcriptional MocR family regulator